MEFNLNTVETLMKTGKVEIDSGVFLTCEKHEIKPHIYVKDNNIVIEFEAPFVYLQITKLGIKRLANIVNPRIESITITDKSYNVKISTLGTWEFIRD